MKSLLIFVNSGFRAASCSREVQSYGNHVGHVIITEISVSIVTRLMACMMCVFTVGEDGDAQA